LQAGRGIFKFNRPDGQHSLVCGNKQFYRLSSESTIDDPIKCPAIPFRWIPILTRPHPQTTYLYLIIIKLTKM